MTSNWEDVSTLVAGDLISVFGDEQDEREEFLKLSKTAQQVGYTHGTVLRWAVQAGEG